MASETPQQQIEGGSAALQQWWTGLTRSQQAAVIVLAGFELVVTSTALWDLVHRPSERVRGFKALWLLACTVQPVGPLAYLALGRRPDGEQQA